MTWWSIKSPDGVLLACAASEEAAWHRVGFARPATRGEAIKQGYRCVEVQLVEPEQASALEQAFIQGAAWWEWHKEGATMWQSDRALALEEAERRTDNGTLGKSPEINAAPTGWAESKEDGK